MKKFGKLFLNYLGFAVLILGFNQICELYSMDNRHRMAIVVLLSFGFEMLKPINQAFVGWLKGKVAKKKEDSLNEK